ncbi:B1135C02.2 [Oryza sativa (japonica cultivar-group)]|uniref:Os01g0325750 protein n=1 Tax=Oryza sativa subsp. japonica TaxID=39947 RepID=A0A0P0V1X8_ORYSJ|nr:Os01g0325750 [Oryza sativa Japonica Group]
MVARRSSSTFGLSCDRLYGRPDRQRCIGGGLLILATSRLVHMPQVSRRFRAHRRRRAPSAPGHWPTAPPGDVRSHKPVPVGSLDRPPQRRQETHRRPSSSAAYVRARATSCSLAVAQNAAPAPQPPATALSPSTSRSPSISSPAACLRPDSRYLPSPRPCPRRRRVGEVWNGRLPKFLLVAVDVFAVPLAQVWALLARHVGGGKKDMVRKCSSSTSSPTDRT